jgi:hypothetical protein
MVLGQYPFCGTSLNTTYEKVRSDALLWMVRIVRNFVLFLANDGLETIAISYRGFR